MNVANPRLERIKSILACPDCGGAIDLWPESAECACCKNSYPIRNGKLFFSKVPEYSDNLDSLKAKLKRRLGRYYYSIGVRLIAPTYPFNFRKWIYRFTDPAQKIVVDSGCGNHRIDDNIICADFFDYEAVDIICDLSNLPFKAGSVDAFVTRSVIEHLLEPQKVIDGFQRCTRLGGMGLHLIPFLFPYHASPNDYQRFTHKGQELLFKDWRVVAQTNATGPVTYMLLGIIEILSTIASFGRERLKAYTYLIFCLLLFPLKFLDAPFVNCRSFLSLAPTIIIVVQKVEDVKLLIPSLSHGLTRKS